MYSDDFYAILLGRFWWSHSLSESLVEAAIDRVRAMFASETAFVEALGAPAAHESLCLLWLTAVEAVCEQRNTTLEDAVWDGNWTLEG